MRKLNKNFYEQRKTVEAMQGGCAMFGSCSCSAVDCVCSPGNSVQNQSIFSTQGKYYFNSYKNSALL